MEVLCEPEMTDPPTANNQDAHVNERGQRHPAHLLFEPLDFIARLAALVPPRQNLTGSTGYLHPNNPYRARITPALWAQGASAGKPAQEKDHTLAEQQAAIRWAKRLEGVFPIDVETCPNCDGTVETAACI